MLHKQLAICAVVLLVPTVNTETGKANELRRYHNKRFFMDTMADMMQGMMDGMTDMMETGMEGMAEGMAAGMEGMAEGMSAGMEGMAAGMAAGMEGMMMAGGWENMESFEASYDTNCIACKCFDGCVMRKSLEQNICQSIWDQINCRVASTQLPTPSTTIMTPTKPKPTKRPTLSFSSSSLSATPASSPSSTSGAQSMQLAPDHKCEKFCAVAAVVKQVSIKNSTATYCPSTSTYDSAEAFEVSCCDVGQSSSWKQGQQVMPSCDQIPHYTPVARFIDGKYVEGSAGVFVSCLSTGETGFQFIHQTCGSVPDILHVSDVSTDAGFNDPDNFYLIHTN